MRIEQHDPSTKTRGERKGHSLLRASAIALIAALAAGFGPSLLDRSFDSAWAQSHGGGGQGAGGQGGGGGHTDGGHDDGGHASGSQGKGQQGGGSGQGQTSPDPDSEGRGPKYGAGKSDDPKGGKPVWAQEGIPEVELGRLNVARSPDHVLQRAFDEAVATLSVTPAMIDFYSLSLADAITVLSLDFDTLTFIDSPLQNLALLKDALDGTSVLTSLGATGSLGTLEAIFLGAASDKTVPITTDTVFAVTTILGYDLTLTQATSLATSAEAVRIAILAGHG